ncbi:hypothetical protein C1H46_028835 [Malus baccata]|uniref:Uncharacterized protein n=1 Tax=Malus baccata TaxID=106549 RepID=A0A540LGR4_MALBA|nr:hypothetical protein C1H46_028835 [Malus baccata]
MMNIRLQQPSQSTIDDRSVTKHRKLVRELISNNISEGNKAIEDKSIGGGGVNTRAEACTGALRTSRENPNNTS